jgi:uncharacterized repeat protein (TIGR03803 family)
MLYGFSLQSLNIPISKLLLDDNGNLFGTTSWYQNMQSGGVFELGRDGNWNAIYIFQGDGARARGDGLLPTGVIKDTSGNLFGTTIEGDRPCQIFTTGCGIVFKIAPDGTETVLYEFGQKTGDGMWPYGVLVADRRGHLYGTTSNGGAYGSGTVYRITP